MKEKLIIVLYGSTGDLSFRKLLPSFSELIKNEELSKETLIIAVGRRDLTTKTYLEFIKEHNKEIELENLNDNVVYHKMQIAESTDYVGLKQLIDNNTTDNSRIVHYLSVAPELMLTVAKSISLENIVKKGDLNHSLVFEKPFGDSYKSAHEINLNLWEFYDEQQIYRMDHYLGKPFVSELLNFRFNNNITKPFFNSKDLVSIEVVAKEKDGVLNRGSFYDVVGATKDMFQSHLLQIVTLLTMNKPKKNEHKYIINEKVNVLKKTEFDQSSIVFGQYKGYLNENNVSDKSLTETLLKIDLTINNKFKKIPVKVITGKGLSKKETYIKLNYKDQSSVTFNLAPNYSIEIVTNSLSQVVEMDYKFHNLENDYSMLILAAINFEKEKFVRWDEIEISWKFTEKILETKKELVIYHEELH